MYSHKMPQKLTTTACFIQEESSSCIYIYMLLRWQLLVTDILFV